jgi:hypothetical protein
MNRSRWLDVCWASSMHGKAESVHEVWYCHEFMAPWLIITGSGLNDWIYYRLLCTITHNHNQLQKLTINLQPNPSSLTAEVSLHSRSLSFYDFPTDWTSSLEQSYAEFYILSARTTHRKHSSSVVACVSVGIPTWSLPSQSIGALAAA